MLDAPFRLDLLGGVDLRRTDGTRVQSILAQPKRIALLAYVAIEADAGFVQRERVISALWPESDEARARQSLRNGLYHIRQSLRTEILLTNGSDDIGVAPELVVDAVRFRRAVNEGRFADAVDLYGGEFFRGFHLGDNQEFEEWLARKRSELQGDALHAFRETALLRQGAGDLEGAGTILRRAQEIAPGDEEILRRRLLLLASQGNRAGALAEARQWIEALQATLDIEPSRATRKLLADLEHGRLDPTEASESKPADPRASSTSRVAAGSGAPTAPPIATAPRRVGGGWRVLVGWVLGPAALLVAAWASSVRTVHLPPAFAGVIVERFEVGDEVGGEAAGLALGTLTARLLDEGTGALVLPAEGVMSSSLDGKDRRLVAGSVRREGEGLIAEMTLASTSRPNEVLVRAAASVNRFDLETLAVRLVAALQVKSGQPLGAQGMVPAFTEVPAAVLPYFEGEIAAEAARRLDATEAYKRAVALDSTFGMAHFHLSMLLQSLGRSEEAFAASDRALALSAKMAEPERARLEAWRVYEWGNVEQALPLYEALARSQGADRSVWLTLGEIGFHWGAQLGIPRAKADSSFAALLRHVPNDADALLHRLRLSAPTATPAEVEGMVERIEALDVSSEVRTEARAIRNLTARRPLDSGVVAWIMEGPYTSESRRLTQLAASARVPWDLAPFIRALPRNEEPAREAMRRLLLVQLAAASGRLEEARAELEALAASHPDRALEYRILLELASPVSPDADLLRALRVRLRVVQTKAVPRFASMYGVAEPGIYGPRAIVLDAMLTRRIGERIDSAETMRQGAALATPFEGDYREMVLSEIAVADGAHERAIGLIGPGRREWHRVRPDPLSHLVGLSRWTRIQSLLAVGDEHDALRWLETLPDVGGYDLMFTPQASLLRARILERQGRTGAAAREYRRAAELWEEADPELEPLVREAQLGARRAGGGPEG